MDGIHNMLDVLIEALRIRPAAQARRRPRSGNPDPVCRVPTRASASAAALAGSGVDA